MDEAQFVTNDRAMVHRKGRVEPMGTVPRADASDVPLHELGLLSACGIGIKTECDGRDVAFVTR